MSKLPSSEHRDHPTLTIQDGYGQNREAVMERNNIVIGREPDCDVVIGDQNVSRHHAVISREEEGFFIKDLNSANGTFVNSQPVTMQLIKHMDIIQMGGAMLVFNDPNNPEFARKNIENKWTAENFNTETLQKIIRQLEDNIARVFKGDSDVIRNIIVCLFADGHLLLEDAPGVGKSLLAQTLAKSVQAQYRRIQFTPDMLPSDITGTNIFDEATGTFKFLPGPIFGNVILADEINRTTPRTQSSLLECMSESSITIDGKGHVLPKPFFVIATQNPEDYHGTYPLPEPQLDRFLMRLSIGYPSPEAEMEILSSQISGHPLNSISYVIKSNDVVYCQAQVRKVKVSPQIKEYIIRIANATREHPALANGCSPRASLALMRCSQSLAAYSGRDFVTPKDVRALLKLVIGHRLRLKLQPQRMEKRGSRPGLHSGFHQAEKRGPVLMIIAMPTKNGILLLLASLAAVGTAIMNVGFATAMIASLLCALTISCFIMAQFSLHGITITRDRTHDAVCGGTLQLPVIAVNRTYLYRMPVVVSEKLPFCRGGSLDAVIPALAPRGSLNGSSHR